MKPLCVCVRGLIAVRVPGRVFYWAISRAAACIKHGRKVGETVYVYSADEYSKMHTYVTLDGKAGFAVKKDGEGCSLFNVGKSGRGGILFDMQVALGMEYIDCFDENDFLPGIYRKHGFVETGRVPWNPAYAPTGWQGGTPDVVFMKKG